MRIVGVALAAGLAFFGSAEKAEAATVYFFIDAETFEQRSVKVDLDGPDRAFVCMLPPATSGCHEVNVRRKRR